MKSFTFVLLVSLSLNGLSQTTKPLNDLSPHLQQFLEVQYEMGGIFSTPAKTNNEIVISTTEGSVYCFTR